MDFRINEYPRYESFIRETERRFRLPPNLLALTLFQASKFDADKIAGKGAHELGVIGIASLTHKDIDLLWEGRDRRKSPLDSIIGCARLLCVNYDKFKNWRLALLAYHSSAETVITAVHYGRAMPIDAHRYVDQVRAECRL